MALWEGRRVRSPGAGNGVPGPARWCVVRAERPEPDATGRRGVKLVMYRINYQCVSCKWLEAQGKWMGIRILIMELLLKSLTR